MRPVVFAILGWGLCLPCVWADPAADELATLREQVRQLTDTVQELTHTVRTQAGRLGELEYAQVPPAKTSGAPAAVLPRPASGGANLSAFNPEIGVLADLVGQLSNSALDTEGNDRLSARELELVIGHPVDPYTRLDATIAFSDFEEASLEEAYITHWGLPGELKTRLGRLRPKVGKAAALHRDSLDTVDEPLVVASYLGAEGISRTAAELSGFLSTPWTGLVHELTLGLMEGGVGEGGTLFGETRRRPSFYAHLKNFWDVSEASNVELGATYLLGSKDADAAYEVNAVGLDATLVHYVTPTNKLKWQSEAYLQARKESFSITEDDTRTNFGKYPLGFYSLVDYRLSPRFGAGGRFDYVEPIDLDPAARARDADTAWSGYVTFYQSEFARWRLQFRHTDFALGGDDNTIFAQGTFAIGVHKHQLQ